MIGVEIDPEKIGLRKAARQFTRMTRRDIYFLFFIPPEGCYDYEFVKIFKGYFKAFECKLWLKKVIKRRLVEAEEREDGELDRGDEAEDLPGEVVLVVDREELVEAEAEREPPRGHDDDEVGRELREPMSVDRRSHAREATPAASSSDSTTRSCTSAPIPPQSGSARFSAAALSVSGSEPAS